MKINELTVNAMCDITLVVKSALAKETKAKKPYLSVELYDGVDTISGNYWDWSSGVIPEPNTIVDINAQVTEWQGTKQLNIKSMRANTTKHIAEFMPASRHDIAAAYREAYSLICKVNDDMLRNLTLDILDEMRQYWLEVPAARGVHHAYVGGTLIHSLGVAKLAKVIAQNIPEANVDLCIVGGMLHDLGKLFTYAINGITIQMTDDGQLYDHIFMGAEFVSDFAKAHVDVNDYNNMKKLQLLRHIILSHHGQLEYGSPVNPQCIEAFIVNHADGLDSTVEQIREASYKVPNNTKWTDRIYTLNNRPQLTPAWVNFVMSTSEEESASV